MNRILSIATMFWCLPLVLVQAMGCAGNPVRGPSGLACDVQSQGPQPGVLEEQARLHMQILTALLNKPDEDPQVTVQSIERYLVDNSDEIRRVAAGIAGRIAEMSPSDRLCYEERWAAFMSEATRGWQESLEAFGEAHSEAAGEIWRVLGEFD